MSTRFDLLWNRRQFLKALSSTAVTVCLEGCESFRGLASQPLEGQGTSEFLKKFGPIDRTLGDRTNPGYSGDDFNRPHRILWNLGDYLAEKVIPEAEEEVPLAIVGGGASGLFTAYTLRDLNPVVLEQAPRLGGNAKGQSWRGLDYALGSAYIDLPAPGTAMRRFYDELKWNEILVERRNADPVEYQGKASKAFWEGETEPGSKAKYLKLARFFKNLCAEKEGLVFPSIPALDPDELQSVKQYDRDDIHAFLAKMVGGKLPPHFETALEHFCWSTYAASAKEMSAAAALNFLAQESAPICVAPGGNAGLLERLIEKLVQTLPTSNLRTSAIVVQVKVEAGSVRVLYEDAQGKLKALRAKQVVLACPKFVAAKILSDIEPERQQAIRRLKYRSYMVANLLLDREVAAKYYDLFLIGNGRTDLSNVEASSERQNATDFVVANFASPNSSRSVLTFYRAFPYDGGRNRIFQPQSYDTYRKNFETQIERDILPLVGVTSKSIRDLRLTRWGHALPLAEKGLYGDDTIAQLRKPFRERVFFVEQDNWAYPAFQTGATEADYWAKSIRKSLT